VQKDAKKRPSAKALLEHRFFTEKAKKPDFLVKALLEGIPSLGERVRELRERENARRGAGDNDIKSQSQCVACWSITVLHLISDAGMYAA
jgi:serine/threonine-protein kinase OSR1/STK39